MLRFNSFISALTLLLIALLATACAAGAPDEPTPAMEGMAMAEMPDDLDTSTTRMTEQGSFQVSINSSLDPLVINQIHSWTVHVETPDGEPVEEAEIAVSGGMPQHNHGFPTAPEITEELGGGDYLLEGVKFSMTGWWELKLAINAGDQSDNVTFNIMLP